MLSEKEKKSTLRSCYSPRKDLLSECCMGVSIIAVLAKAHSREGCTTVLLYCSVVWCVCEEGACMRHGSRSVCLRQSWFAQVPHSLSAIHLSVQHWFTNFMFPHCRACVGAECIYIWGWQEQGLRSFGEVGASCTVVATRRHVAALQHEREHTQCQWKSKGTWNRKSCLQLVSRFLHPDALRMCVCEPD